MAGAGYKLFSTGDVLTASDVNTYLQQQTVMVFADASARTTALSGVLAEGMMSYLQDTDTVYVYNGAAWVGVSQDQTPLTTKGDLFTYSTADARLPVGNNGETLVADSSASTGLRWQGNFAAGKNKFINGDFQIWQRGTSFSSNGYSADRWFASVDAGTFTAVRSTDAPTGAAYSLLLTATSATNAQIQQKVESLNMSALAGQTVTISIWIKSTSGTPSVDYYLAYPNSADNYSGETFIASGALTGSSPSSSWTRYSVTLTLPANAKNGLKAIFYRNATTTSSTTYFANAMIELGNVATAFQTATGTLAGELAACQRYYFRMTGDPSANYPVFGNGSASSTGNVVIYVKHPVTMRVEPTSLDQGNLGVYDGGGVTGSPTSVTLDTDIQSKDYSAINFAKAASFTQFRPYALLGNANSAAYLGLSAEL